MEEKKLNMELSRKDINGFAYKTEGDATRIDFQGKDMNKYMGDGYNDNWFELRFSSLGPDRRGYHSTFQHNKK